MPHLHPTALLLSCSLVSSIAAAAPALVNPQPIADDDYRFVSQRCGLQLGINPLVGGRISILQIAGHTIVTPYACGKNAYDPRAACNGSGSTFWTSPQHAWPNASWPPVVSLDGAAYSSNIVRDHMLMSSPANDALGANVDKDIALDESRCTIHLNYTLKASREVSLAPWEITRVPRGGIALFLIGDKSRFAAGPLQPQITLSNDESVAWFDDTAIPILDSKSGAKLIADGRDGWLAYARDGYIFIKRFDDVPFESIAPNEGDVEIYAGGNYLELEVQGRFIAMKENDRQPWKITWRVVKIPDSVKIAAGSQTLLKFVQQQASIP